MAVLVGGVVPLGTVMAGAATSGDWVYDVSVLDDGSSVVLIQGYTGNDTNVVIPETINSLPVIGFSDIDVFPDFLTDNDKGLTYIESITLPSTITYFAASSAFNTRGLAFLKNVFVAEGNPLFYDIDGVLFRRSETFSNYGETELVFYPPGRTDETYAVPFDTDLIGSHAFLRCGYNNILHLVDADNKQFIQSYPFGKLKKVIIGGETQIEADSFYSESYRSHSFIDIEVDKNHLYYTSDSDGYVFDTSQNTTSLIHIPYKALFARSLILPNSFDSCLIVDFIPHGFDWIWLSGRRFYDNDGYSNASHQNKINFALSDIRFPARVSYIYGRSNKLKFSVDENNPTLSIIDGCLFNKNSGTLLSLLNPAPFHILPSEIKHIADGVFAQSHYYYDTENQVNLCIPPNTESISAKAFDRVKSGLTIFGEKGSYAEIYANANSIPFEVCDGRHDGWTVDPPEKEEDTDGDGLPDMWERNGLDINDDGVIDLPLSQMGANPNKPDIFIEVDYMWKQIPQSVFDALSDDDERALEWRTRRVEGKDILEVKLAPSAESLKLVYDAFQAQGINLHIDAGSDSIEFVTGKKWGALSGSNEIPYTQKLARGSNNANWIHLVNENLAVNRRNVFRHVIFCDKLDEGDSGVASGIPGQYIIIAEGFLVDSLLSKKDIGGATWGNYNLLRATAGTLMHELGHTLGLRHGGGDDIPYKPNYLSVMNYAYQASGLYATKGSRCENAIDYSSWKLPDLDMKRIVESKGFDPNGLTAGTGLRALWWVDGKRYNTNDVISKNMIDFNHNGDASDTLEVQFQDPNFVNLSSRPTPGWDGQTLESQNDWENIVYAGGGIGTNAYGAGATQITISPDNELPVELSWDEIVEYDLIDNPDSSGIFVINPAAKPLEYKGKLTLTVTNAQGAITWSSDNKQVKVNPTTGEITSVYSFVKTGTARIAATDGQSTAYYDLKIAPNWWQWILIILLFGWIWY